MGADASKPAEGEEPVLSVDEKKRQIARMDDIVRNRVRGGVQYNMKIVLCGARGTGKTSLFNRFQGLSFSNTYVPTPEIQSATINWTFKNNADHVKVEVWDVVDVALNKKATPKKPVYDGTNTGQHVIELLDSSVVDIYKGTQAVIFLINPFSKLSYIYVRDKFKEVPVDVSILLILNFRDVKDGAEVPDACKTNTPNEPRITMQDVQALCNEINAFRQKTAYPYNPAVATASAAVAETVKPVEQSKSLNEIAKEKETEDSSAGSSAAAEKEGGEGKDEDGSDPPVDDMTKLALQNIDNITTTHKSENPMIPSASPSSSIIDSKRSLNTTTEGVHAFEISLNNCFGLLHVHKFLDIPFLKLKKQTLLEVLNKVDEELVDSNLTLRNAVLTANYQEYESLHAKRVKDREAAVAAQAAAAASANVTPVHPSQQQQHLQQQQMSAQLSSPNPLGSYVSQANGGGGNAADAAKYNPDDYVHGVTGVSGGLKSSLSKSRDEADSEDDEGGFLALKRTPLVKGKKNKTKIIKPEIVEDTGPVTPKSATVFKLSHNDEYEALSVNKKASSAAGGGGAAGGSISGGVGAGLDKELRKSKKDKKKEVVPEPPPKVKSQFEQEVESFQPTMDEGFFDPSDDEEKRRLESKQRVRGALKSNEISGVVTSKMNAKDLNVLSPASSGASASASGAATTASKSSSGATNSPRTPSSGYGGGGGGGGAGSVKLRGGQTVDLAKSRSKDLDDEDMDSFLASPSTSNRKSISKESSGSSLTKSKKASSKVSSDDDEEDAPVKVAPVKSSGGLRKPVKKSKALPDMEL